MSNSIEVDKINNDSITEESFLPETLIKKLERNIPRTLPFDQQQIPTSSSGIDDPIVHDLMKLSSHKSSIVTERHNNRISPESINQYSSKLFELLYLLNEESKLDDTSRISIESTLFDLTSYIPVSSVNDGQSTQQQPIFYPNETLSKILFDNYNQLLKFSSNYFNLSLSSHITKYLVELIYALNYWEIYHLIYLLSDLEYFLKLINFEIYQTSFGPIIKPPENYLSTPMQSGLQYPYPYPFYNYSYHSFDSSASKRKMSHINIKPYIDITLKNIDIPVRKKQKILTSDEEDLKHIDIEKQMDKKKQVSSVVKPENNDSSDYSEDESGANQIRNSDDEREINDSSAQNFLNEEEQTYDIANQLRIIQPSPTLTTSTLLTTNASNTTTADEDKKYKSKSGVIHQCHLVDPVSLRPCLKIFYGKNELLRHQEFVHATKKKIYKCIYCSRNGSKVQSYPRHDSLARHIRRKHGVTGKENKMAVNYAKENVEIIDDPHQLLSNQQQIEKPLPHPQFLNSDFTIKSSYAGFLSFSSRENVQHRNHTANNPSHQNKNRVVEVIELPPINEGSSEQQARQAQHQNRIPPHDPQQQPPLRVHSPPQLSNNSPTEQHLHPSRQPPPPISYHPHPSTTRPIKVESVNFNKPESSIIKESFQKFRLNQSPIHSSASINQPSLLHPSSSQHQPQLYHFDNKTGPSREVRNSMDISYLNSPDPNVSK